MAASVGSAAAGVPVADPDQPVDNSEQRQAVAQISEGVVGRLLQSGDRPIANAVIAAKSLDRPAKAIPDIAIMTNAAGRFQWPLRPGAYQLAAMLDGRQVATATVTVEPGQVTTIDLFTRP